MLLQRLKLDPTCGFNYQYMGYAEYEFGATSFGRTGIALAWKENDFHAKRVQFVAKYGMSTFAPIDVLVIGRKETIDQITGNLHIIEQKSNPRTNDEANVGWMLVDRCPQGMIPEAHPTPLLILRCNIDDVSKRVEQFIKAPLDYLESLEAEQAA